MELLFVVVVAACSRQPPPDLAATGPHFSHGPASLNRDLASLRALSARYHDVDKAIDAGWYVPVPDCRDNPPVGGVGWHFLNPDFLGPEPDVLEPQILVYEPQKNGRLRFVAVEYIIPYDVLPADADPPVLMGQEFLPNAGDQLWMLHVWVGRHNPDGMFETWNPSVSCQYAE